MNFLRFHCETSPGVHDPTPNKRWAMDGFLLKRQFQVNKRALL